MPSKWKALLKEERSRTEMLEKDGVLSASDAAAIKQTLSSIKRDMDALQRLAKSSPASVEVQKQMVRLLEQRKQSEQLLQANVRIIKENEKNDHQPSRQKAFFQKSGELIARSWERIASALRKFVETIKEMHRNHRFRTQRSINHEPAHLTEEEKRAIEAFETSIREINEKDGETPTLNEKSRNTGAQEQETAKSTPEDNNSRLSIDPGSLRAAKDAYTKFHGTLLPGEEATFIRYKEDGSPYSIHLRHGEKDESILFESGGVELDITSIVAEMQDPIRVTEKTEKTAESKAPPAPSGSRARTDALLNDSFHESAVQGAQRAARKGPAINVPEKAFDYSRLKPSPNYITPAGKAKSAEPYNPQRTQARGKKHEDISR